VRAIKAGGVNCLSYLWCRARQRASNAVLYTLESLLTYDGRQVNLISRTEQ